MLSIIFWLIVIAIAAVLIIAAMRPDTFRIERSISIDAPPQKVFALLQDFKAWEAWSPWEKVDPAIQRSYSGAEHGRGAIYAWQGNKQIGSGRMEIEECHPDASMKIYLHFIKPFEAHNHVDFTLTPQGSGSQTSTQLSQAMYGPSPFISKVMGLVFNMEKMVGGKYEEGLRSIKALAERG
jgi:uncharacterized protein YndB with AHSA1/START domain